MIKDHHEGYISWDEFERNQKQIVLNNYGRAGGIKTGRGGRALLRIEGSSPQPQDSSLQ
jgi:hypothetical protein